MHVLTFLPNGDKVNNSRSCLRLYTSFYISASLFLCLRRYNIVIDAAHHSASLLQMFHCISNKAGALKAANAPLGACSSYILSAWFYLKWQNHNSGTCICLKVSQGVLAELLHLIQPIMCVKKGLIFSCFLLDAYKPLSSVILSLICACTWLNDCQHNFTSFIKTCKKNHLIISS